MNLNIQIYSLFFSFIFGIVFYFLLEVLNVIKLKVKLLFRVIISFFFIILSSLLYFGGLLYINNGYLHIYFLVMIAVGYIVIYIIKTIWFTH